MLHSGLFNRATGQVTEAVEGPSRDDIQAFRDIIEQFNPQFFDVGQQLIDRGLGTATDPLIEMQRMRGIEDLRGRLSRRGITGSVGLNQIARTNLGFDELALGRRDQALETGFGLQSIGIQNAAAPAGLSIAELAARMSGRQQSGGGGQSCFIICLILTEYLLLAGLLSPALFTAHAAYAVERYSPADYTGYRRWADPLVCVIQRWCWLRYAVGWAINRYTEETAWRMELGGRSNMAGKFFAFLIPSLSRVAGSLSWR